MTYNNASNHADKDLAHGLNLFGKVGRKLADEDTDDHADDNPHGEVGLLPQEAEAGGDGGKGRGELATLLGSAIVGVHDGLAVFDLHILCCVFAG